MDFKQENQITLADGTLVRQRLRRRRRLRTWIAALGVATATMVNAAGAQARDLCMDPNGGGHWVLKGFKIPAKNKCDSVYGLEIGPQHGVMSGMACTTANGGFLRMHYTEHNADPFHGPSYFETGSCNVELPLLPGGWTLGECWGTYLTSPGDHHRFYQGIKFQTCDVDVPRP